MLRNCQWLLSNSEILKLSNICKYIFEKYCTIKLGTCQKNIKMYTLITYILIITLFLFTGKCLSIYTVVSNHFGVKL